MFSRFQQGLTLVEVMVTVALLGIIAAVALPNYSAYMTNSRVPPGLEQLASTATRLEQFYQDFGTYGASTCGNGLAMPTPTNYKQLSCTLKSSGQGFDLVAEGDGKLAGYKYTVDHRGVRRTLSHPKGVPSSSCWSVKGTVCDAS